jgi:transposase-like protein
MNTYKYHRFPLDIIGYTARLYCRSNLRLSGFENLLVERGAWCPDRALWRAQMI